MSKGREDTTIKISDFNIHDFMTTWLVRMSESKVNPNQWHFLNTVQLGVDEEAVPVCVEFLEQGLDIRVCAQRLFELVEAYPAIAVGIYF